MATIPPFTAVGSRYIILVADPLNAEQESDETNNVVSFPVMVAAGGNVLPDLELWRPSLSFSAVPLGGSTGAFTFINNRGPGGVPAYEIGFYLSVDTVFSASTDVFLGLVTGGLSSPGGTIHSAPMLTVPLTTAPGSYYLVLMADPRNVVAESNENNNSRALPLRVTGAVTAVADPALMNADIYPNPVARGTALNVQMPGSGPPANVALYNTVGQLAAQQMSAGPITQINTRALPAGIYLLRITANQHAASFRVVVQ